MKITAVVSMWMCAGFALVCFAVAGQGFMAVSEMVDPSGTPFVLDRGAVTLTVLGADRAVEVKGCTGG